MNLNEIDDYISEELRYAKEKNTIPKIVHYFWFGNKPKSDLLQNCIASWSRYLPDYKIIEWNLQNFDFTNNRYAREAYEQKEWAFLSDYARFFTLFKYGGVYCDTDVEIKQNLDSFLNKNCVIGRMTHELTNAHFLMAKANNAFIKSMLDYYNHPRTFIVEQKFKDKTPLQITSTKILENKYNIKINNNKLIETEDVSIYPFKYFSAKSVLTNKNYIGKKTYAVHHFNGSWNNNKGTSSKFRSFLFYIFGEEFLVKTKRRICFWQKRKDKLDVYELYKEEIKSIDEDKKQS